MISRNSCYEDTNNIIKIYDKLLSDLDRLVQKHKIAKPNLLIAAKYFNAEILSRFIAKTKHQLFGENTVQDAYIKWSELKKEHPNLKLHLIGKLQSNKIKKAVRLFSTIETVASEKTALMIKSSAVNLGIDTPKIYVQVNIGNEPNKNGILIEEFDEKFKKINNIIPVAGIMCIPPQDKNVSQYFKHTKNLAIKYNLTNISMGMSNDYSQALKYGSTEIRIGRLLCS